MSELTRALKLVFIANWKTPGIMRICIDLGEKWFMILVRTDCFINKIINSFNSEQKYWNFIFISFGSRSKIKGLQKLKKKIMK